MGIIVPEPHWDKLYRAELLTIVQNRIDDHPRSAQQLLGPSGIGGCERKVAWSLAYGSASDGPGGWAAAKGTQLHAWYDDIFSTVDRTMPDGSQRFFTEIALESSNPDILAGGTCDLYDKLYERVVDWKFPGDWTIKGVRSGQLSESYYVQCMVYAYHATLMGMKVSSVAIGYMPMAGDDLHSDGKGAILPVWDYDESVAIDRIANLRRIKNLLDCAPPQQVFDIMDRKSDFCSNCPASIMSGDRRANCPGVSLGIPKPTGNPFNA